MWLCNSSSKSITVTTVPSASSFCVPLSPLASQFFSFHFCPGGLSGFSCLSETRTLTLVLHFHQILFAVHSLSNIIIFSSPNKYILLSVLFSSTQQQHSAFRHHFTSLLFVFSIIPRQFLVVSYNSSNPILPVNSQAHICVEKIHKINKSYLYKQKRVVSMNNSDPSGYVFRIGGFSFNEQKPILLDFTGLNSPHSAR